MKTDEWYDVDKKNIKNKINILKNKLVEII